MAVEGSSDSDIACTFPPAAPHAAVLFQRHGHINILDLVELTIESIKLADDIIVKRSGHIDLLVSNLDLHIGLPLLRTNWDYGVVPFEHSVRCCQGIFHGRSDHRSSKSVVCAH